VDILIIIIGLIPAGGGILGPIVVAILFLLLFFALFPVFSGGRVWVGIACLMCYVNGAWPVYIFLVRAFPAMYTDSATRVLWVAFIIYYLLIWIAFLIDVFIFDGKHRVRGLYAIILLIGWFVMGA